MKSALEGGFDMTNEELLMLRCMVEYIEKISSNDYVYAHTNSDSVSLEECRRWLESEQYRHGEGRKYGSAVPAGFEPHEYVITNGVKTWTKGDR
jgi:hypothetical protein